MHPSKQNKHIDKRVSERNIWADNFYTIEKKKQEYTLKSEMWEAQRWLQIFQDEDYFLKPASVLVQKFPEYFYFKWK